VREHHLLHFHAIDGAQLAGQAPAHLLVSDHLQDDDPLRRRSSRLNLVQPQARLDVRAVLREQALDPDGFPQAIRDVNAEDEMSHRDEVLQTRKLTAVLLS
jgi:hypothetical protein